MNYWFSFQIKDEKDSLPDVLRNISAGINKPDHHYNENGHRTANLLLPSLNKEKVEKQFLKGFFPFFFSLFLIIRKA